MYEDNRTEAEKTAGFQYDTETGVVYLKVAARERIVRMLPNQYALQRHGTHRFRGAIPGWHPILGPIEHTSSVDAVRWAERNKDIQSNPAMDPCDP